MEKTVLAPNIRQKWSITTESVQRLPISGQAKTELMVSRTRTMTTKRIADNRDIDALINLLQLQAGEQRKPEELGNYDQVNNAETDSDDDYGDADSLAPDLIPTTGRDRLKSQFLDRIAELYRGRKVEGLCGVQCFLKARTNSTSTYPVITISTTSITISSRGLHSTGVKQLLTFSCVKHVMVC